jgi:hypothetical protein
MQREKNLLEKGSRELPHEGYRGNRVFMDEQE